MTAFPRFAPWLVAVAAFLAFGVRPVAASTIRVNSFVQDDDRAHVCTLTNAIHAANTDLPVAGCSAGFGADTIIIPPGTFPVLVPFHLDFFGDSTAFPVITTAITIVGEGPGASVIERYSGAVMPFRLFRSSSNAVFELRHLTLRGGTVPNHKGGAIFAEDNVVIAGNVRFENNEAQFGGALADLNWIGTLGGKFTIEGSTFVNNRATNGGGAIQVSRGGTLTVRGSQFRDNFAGSWGGAIYTPNGNDAPTSIEQSQFIDNRSDETGGAIQSTAPALTGVLFERNSSRDRGGALYSYGGRPVIAQSTFTENTSKRGGAVEVHEGSIEIAGSTFAGNAATDFEAGALFLDDRPRTSRITNSTFSGNATAAGGAITLQSGRLAINFSTIAFNTNSAGGWSVGIVSAFNGNNEVVLANTIVAGNTSDAAEFDVYFNPESGDRFVSEGHNLIGSDQYAPGVFTQPGDLAGTATSLLAARLLPLADNGGPTKTHALDAGSPALDAASPTCDAADQRGKLRPGPGSVACDIGAYEHGTYYALQLTVNGSGSVAGLPGTASCAGSCTAEPGVGTVVTLVAQPAAGFALVTWDGACSDASPTCVVTMNGAQAVTATFAAAGGDTAIALTSSPNPSAVDEPVIFTATVTPAPGALGTPTGQVRFLDTTGPAIIGTAQLDATGKAVLTINSLPQGQRVIQALYNGDDLFAGSSSAPLSQRVGVLANVAPSFAMPAFAPAIDEDAGVQLVPHFASALIIGPPHENTQNFVGFTLTPINTVGTVTFVSGPILALDGTLTYEVSPDSNGLATFRVTLTDDGGTDAGGRDTSAPQDLTITVNAINDRPSFAIAADPPASDEDGGAQTVPHFTSAISMGPADESSQSPAAYSIVQIGSTGGLTFANAPAIDPVSGTLTYRASANANGIATFNATLHDNGGDVAPHHNGSAPQMFTITVTGVNDPPAVTPPAAQSHTDQEQIALVITATDLENDALSYHATGLPPGLSIDAATGRISGKPEPVAGEQQFSVTVTVTDATGAESRATFTWTLTHAQPPDLELNIQEQLAVVDSILPTAGPLAIAITVPEQLEVSDSLAPTTGPLPVALTVPEQLEITDSVGTARENTPAGANVRVDLGGGVVVTFAGVDGPGQTTATLEQVPDPPAGFERTVPPVGFEIRSTASTNSPIEVCLAHPATAVPPRLMHFELGRWVDRTTANQVNVVCGTVAHLSPFAVFVPIAIEGRMHGQGSVDAAGDHRFEFRIAEREIGEERGRLALTVKTPKSGNNKARTDRFRSTEVGAIAFTDDPGFRPGHRQKPAADAASFAGIGTWNGVEGYSFEAQATDQGEPSRGRDFLRVTIRDASGAVVTTIEGLLTEGNIQSQRLAGR